MKLKKTKPILNKERFANLSLVGIVLFFISVTFYYGRWTLFLKSIGAIVVLIISTLLLIK
jgi:hypothetical protein